VSREKKFRQVFSLATPQRKRHVREQDQADEDERQGVHRRDRKRRAPRGRQDAAEDFREGDRVEGADVGPTIVGFGAYHYAYDSGRSGSICVVGFSPRKANLVIYVFDFPGKADLLQKLGKHKGGLKQCLYLNKLVDVDLAVLEKILKAGVAETKRPGP
jgi:hypothetical protein